jgi:hypothetical protein
MEVRKSSARANQLFSVHTETYHAGMTQSAGAVSTRDSLADALPKIFLATLVANLPMLALLLVPQLMRGRAGSETLLFIGSALYLALIAVALTISPRASVWTVPRAGVWTARTARQTVHSIRRSHAREFWLRVAEWLLLFVLAQAIGLFIAWLMPYIRDNPQFGAAGEPRWIINYGNYAVQAVTIYLFSCLSFAWFGARLRQLALPR